jgi:hypothetical protein
MFCGQQSETLDHLLLACVFSKEVWVIVIGLLHLEMGLSASGMQVASCLEWWLLSRKLIPKGLQRGFGSLFLLVGWMLWKEGNSRTFGRQSSTSRQLLRKIIEEANIWVRASYKHVQSLIEAL